MEQQTSLQWELGGKLYVIRPDEVSASLAREYRAATGMSFRQAMLELSSDGADIDILQGLCFLARRQAGELITLADIDDFTYGDALTLKLVDAAGDAEDPDSPEA